MGERHDAGHSVAEARERVSAIAEELSRRANGAYVKARAKENLKERARIKMRMKGYEARDRLLDNPLLLGLVSGAAAAIVGKALKASRERRWDSSEWSHGGRYLHDEGWTGPESPLITDDASFRGEIHQGVRGADLGGAEETGTGYGFEDAPEGIKEKAAQIRDKASMKLSEVGDRARHAASRVRAEEHPEVWATGAVLAGAFFGSLMPLTDRERRMLGPAKTRAQSGLHTFKQEARGQVEGLKENARAAVSGMASELGLTEEGPDRHRSGQQSTWQQSPSRPSWKAEGSTPDDERGEGSGFGYRDPDDLNRR